MPNAANRFAAPRPIPLAPPVITAVRPSANAGCCGMPLLLLPARSVEVNRHVFGLRKAFEHSLERELAAYAALLVAAVGVPGGLAQLLFTWTQPDSIACAARSPPAIGTKPSSWVIGGPI